jgi:hypothetical protein
MNTPLVMKLATAFVAFSISAHSAEVFSVEALTTTYPVTEAAQFNAVDGDGNFTNPYNIYGTTDVGNGSGVSITANFNGDSSAINTGYQGVVYNGQTGAINHATTYFGPKFYVGVNRQDWAQTAQVSHNNGNGYRIRSNNVSASKIGTAQVGVEGDENYAAATGNGGNPFNTKALFMFDADTSSLSEGDYLIFNDTDTLYAKLSVPGTLGPNWTGSGTASRVSLATYRAVVKAKGPNDVNAQYYAGTLYTVDLDALPDSSSTYDVTETGATATWTLMPDIEVDADGAQVFDDTNLTVDTSESATTVPGKFLTNITQVGFLLETDTNENTGGYNYGVRQFIANASSPNDAHPSGIEWSEDFTSQINGNGTFLTYEGSQLYDGVVDPANLLTGASHAFKWASNGDGLTATPASTITQENNQIVLDVINVGTAGEVNIRMVGPGTENARRVRPPSHEVSFEIDLIEFRYGQADLLLQTRGYDGYVRSVIGATGIVKYSTWGSALNDYQHTNFDSISGPSSLTGVVIADGGTVDPSAGGVVTVDISGNAEGTVVLNAAGDAVESVTLSGDLTGYTAEPTLAWTGMSAEPTVSFNYSYTVGNTNRQNVVEANMRDLDGDFDGTNDTLELPGTLLADGQILTYIQSYDNSDDSISFYYSIDGSTPQFITKLTAADHSPRGQGFFDVSTGNKWGKPNNQDAVWIQYKRWNNNHSSNQVSAKVGINSITVATSDDDRDGVINRNDALPNNPLESVDSDSDGVGDNSDQHPGYNDSVISAGITQEVWDASQAALTTAQTAQATAETAQATAEADLATANTALSTAQSALITAQTAQATAETALANAREARAGSTVIDVANDVATITLRVEQTSDVSDWSSATTSDHAIDLSAPTGASFYRFTIPE